MIDKVPEIKAFLKTHFEPGSLDDFTLIKTTGALLELLFDVFPRGCIDPFDLYDILTSLGYQPQKNSKTEKLGEDKTVTIIQFAWVLKEITS